MLTIAGGIVLGGLALAFLLKTRAGWYVLIGAVPAILAGGLLTWIAISGATDSTHQSDVGTLLWWLAVPSLSLAVGWWTPRTVAYYRTAKESEGYEPWPALKMASEEAFNEALYTLVGIAFTVSLFVAPFLWWKGSGSVRTLGQDATVGAWGFTGLMLGVIGFGRIRDRLPVGTRAETLTKALVVLVILGVVAIVIVGLSLD